MPKEYIKNMAAQDLLKRLLTSTTLKTSSLLSESTLFGDIDFINTNVPVINVALSGSIDRGLPSGITFLYGDSRNFKSLLGLIMVKGYLDKYEDGVCVFYDSEKGITPAYLNSIGINPERVIHCPIRNVEELKFDIVKKLNETDGSDSKIIFFIDSIGNLASLKEVEDAGDGKSVADMSRAKAIKSLWRIITPTIAFNNFACVAINHGYETLDLFPQKVMGGGKGNMLASNNVINITKSQEKEGTELVGFKFMMTIDKSRFVKEKSKIPFIVNFDKGLNIWGGFLDLCLEFGNIIKPSNGWYQLVNKETGEVIGTKMREKDLYKREIMEPIFNDPEFKKFVEDQYCIAQGTLLQS